MPSGETGETVRVDVASAPCPHCGGESPRKERVVYVNLNPSDLWTAQEVAAYLRMSLSWVRHATAAGKLPVRRFGASTRYVPDEIAAYVRGEWTPRKG